jgi:hypothetical protein
LKLFGIEKSNQEAFLVGNRIKVIDNDYRQDYYEVVQNRQQHIQDDNDDTIQTGGVAGYR